MGEIIEKIKNKMRGRPILGRLVPAGNMGLGGGLQSLRPGIFNKMKMGRW